MCTLILIHRHVPGAPLLVAANRDEYYDRPAAGPEIWSSSRWGTVLTPRDLRAGGTWLGLNRAGIFAAVTNRPANTPVQTPDPDRESRGHLVLDALQGDDVVAIADQLAGLPAGKYNPFNLLVADVNRAFVVSYEDQGVALKELDPGTHVIGNVDPDDRSHHKTARILAEAEAAARRPADEVLEELAKLCRSHDGAPRDGSPAGPTDDTCIHLGDRGQQGYGTRSSLLLRLSGSGLANDASNDETEDNTKKNTRGATTATTATTITTESNQQDNDTRRVCDQTPLDAGVDVLRYADGPPCEQPFRDYTALLHELSQRARYPEEETHARKAS
jgi:uncharacterized protein with NRDE domain